MANHKSALKRIRSSLRRTNINRTQKTHIKSLFKQVDLAISDGNKEQAQSSLKSAESAMMTGVSKGIFHLNTASRRVSRLTKRVKAI